MKKYGLLVVLILVITLLPVAVYAQDGEPEPLELAGGYTILLPDGWEQAEEDGVYTFTQDDRSITVTLPEALAAELELTEDMDAADVLVAVYATLLEQELDKEADVQSQLAGDRVFMATHEFESEDGAERGMSVVLELGAGQFALMEFRSPAEAFEEALPDALQTMLSLQVAVPADAEPCYVRAAKDYVDLRVGPGLNRGAYTNMDTAEAYLVMGKKTLDDGTLWWRLDIADTGGANELWVADADVTTEGDCQYVPDMDAPPIISPSGSSGGSLFFDCYYDFARGKIICRITIR
ncbi:MAG: hypothetical protein JXA10_13995 [Anaerolineae bacterium]|nr:hypothetical protein [Anaerolineae bacterium]